MNVKYIKFKDNEFLTLYAKQRTTKDNILLEQLRLFNKLLRYTASKPEQWPTVQDMNTRLTLELMDGTIKSYVELIKQLKSECADTTSELATVYLEYLKSVFKGVNKYDN